MRQHPIPQNVLDVEFKLFTKFTLREFAFLAVGVGGGGIFLFLTSKGVIPGIIGIPVFIVMAGIGAFLGLVPINDQPADKFIINYFNAINRPTQRVWLNKELKTEREKPLVTPEKKKSKIIGGGKVEEKEVETENDTVTDIFEVDQKGTTSTQTKSAFQDKEGEEIIQQTEVEIDTGPRPLDNSDNLLVITEENISRYQFDIKSKDKLPGNINIWLATRDNKAIPNINTYLKDGDGKLLYANKTGPNGYFLTNQVYPEGVYNIEFQKDGIRIPDIKLVIGKNSSKLPIRINTI
jgi:hypothetical protein